MPEDTMNLKRPLIALAAALSTIPAMAAPAPSASPAENGDIFDLSLEQLMEVVVTSVSKRSQPLSSTPAAVHVITADDIRRSGATNLPEALKLAPGVHVANFSNNRWNVSVRGFGGRYANKLLVLQDGRSMYSQAYSGVLWEFNDVPLETIERIEVIRGPGASIWGANAVNGVINIITRKARDAQGSQVATTMGSELRGGLFVSHGLALAPDTHLEVHAKSHYVGPSATGGDGPARDSWRTRQAGFRLDGGHGSDSFRLQGSVRSSAAGDHFVQPSPADAPPYSFTSTGESAYVLGRWEHASGSGVNHSLQSYVEQSRIDIGIGSEDRSTFDIEYQQQQAVGDRLNFVWGAGWRNIRGHITGRMPYVESEEERSRTNILSLFAQGEFALVPERWMLTLGSRIEQRGDSDMAFQPNARILFTPTPAHSLWASVARAARTPTSVEQEIPATYLPVVPTGLPAPFDHIQPIVNSNPDFGTEQLDALDIGWRANWSRQLSTEVAAYHYRYRDLRNATSMSAPYFDFSRMQLVQPLLLDTTERAWANGIELSADWNVTPSWRLAPSLSLYRIYNISIDREAEFAVGTPKRLFTLRSSYDVSPSLQWDVWLRHASETRTFRYVPSRRIDAYWTLDMHLGWKVNRALELSLVGKNLLDQRHVEAINEPIPSIITAVERSFYLKADWRF